MTNSSQIRAYSALFAVYFFWGTTYLGIRMALESFAPAPLIALRFSLSGIILLIAARLYGARFPRGADLWKTAFYGVLLLGGGTGSLVFAEKWIPSGTAALFITAQPFWMVGLEALFPGGEKLHGPTLVGILIGFAGVLTLIAPGGAAGGQGSGLIAGFLLLQFGCASWSLGSVLQKRLRTGIHPVVTGAIGQFATGLVFLPVALLVPHSVRLSTRGLLALCWLVVFGSIVGYSAYIYAITHLSVAIVSTYTYVNPLVAISLGWLFYREHFGIRELIAMITVFAGVAVVKYSGQRRPEEGRSRAA